MLVADIRRTVAAHYGLTDAAMLNGCKRRHYARPRQVAMWLARNLTDKSLRQIGAAMGGRHHSTVLDGIRQIDAMRPSIAPDIFAILGRLPA